ncbi:Rv3235 family protein [Marmoricola sp. RAF53]|uniref:Rv3235 family protein n=1 Tax=Marmoricola sp. RAF53 TaxID=3233059 RepID=UPI003F951BA8
MKLTALAVVPPFPPPTPPRGIASVVALPIDRGEHVVPIATTQEKLAFEADPSGSGERPRLRLVTGDETELDRFAARFAQAVVEVIGGDRGVHQLMRWTTDEVYADMLRRSQALQRTTPPQQRVRRLRAQVRSVHLSRPHPEAAEISIHVRHGARSRAIAARIELIEGRWRCSVLQFG